MSEAEREKQRERSRQYYYKHKEEILARQKAYQKERYKTDELYRQSVLDKNKKYCEEHLEKMKESKRKSQAKYMMKKRENGEAPITKDIVINKLQQENEQLKERIDKAIELLQNSQVYNSRSNGKTLFMKLIDEEIKILKGDE